MHALPHSLQTYPPPVLPRDFKPVHKATSTETGVCVCVCVSVCVSMCLCPPFHQFDCDTHHTHPTHEWDSIVKFDGCIQGSRCLCVCEINAMHAVVAEYMMGRVPTTSCAMVQVPAVSSAPHMLSSTAHTL